MSNILIIGEHDGSNVSNEELSRQCYGLNLCFAENLASLYASMETASEILISVFRYRLMAQVSEKDTTMVNQMKNLVDRIVMQKMGQHNTRFAFPNADKLIDSHACIFNPGLSVDYGVLKHSLTGEVIGSMYQNEKLLPEMLNNLALFLQSGTKQ